MDAIVFIIIALIFVSAKQSDAKQMVNSQEEELIVPNINRASRLNETFYHDEHAFCEIANALGFPKELQ